MLVKALPQPSKKHGETVCCAGLTAEGEWKRLFPIRFRHLSGESAFKRWDWVEFSYSRPISDKRHESCRVHEESLRVAGTMRDREQAGFLNRHVLPSIATAQESGRSLALIRPRNPRFIHKRRSASEIEARREAFRESARQNSMFDKQLAEIEPSPFTFRFKFEDDAAHDFENADWEAHAMFWNGLRSGKTETEVLDWMHETFNVKYPKRGMLFALGNMAKRPQTWQLLGVIRADEPLQATFSF